MRVGDPIQMADAVTDAAQSRERDKWGYVPPGGGESYAMLADRVRSIRDLVETSR